MQMRKRHLIGLWVVLVLTFENILAQTAVFDLGTSNWNGNFPGSGTFNQTVSGIQVTGTASRIVDNNVDATSVFSGNENPAIARNFSYVFPANSTVSIDFFHLTVNSTSDPESVGNFSQAPDQFVLGTGHSLTVSGGQLEGSSTATTATVTTLTWEGVNGLSFDIAANGNPAFIGHRNMVVTRGQAQQVPVLSPWGMSVLVLSLLLMTLIMNYRRPEFKKSQS